MSTIKSEYAAILFRALASPFGIALRSTSVQDALRARQEFKRQADMDPQFRDLMFLRSLDDVCEFWICKTAPEEAGAA